MEITDTELRQAYATSAPPIVPPKPRLTLAEACAELTLGIVEYHIPGPVCGCGCGS